MIPEVVVLEVVVPLPSEPSPNCAQSSWFYCFNFSFSSISNSMRSIFRTPASIKNEIASRNSSSVISPAAQKAATAFTQAGIHSLLLKRIMMAKSYQLWLQTTLQLQVNA